jgi:peroxiredoxin (alkyl hydroperoxide reductase subunit C)
VLAISTDSHHTHLAWSRTSRKDGGVGQLNIPLVADTSKKISAAYGVLVTDEEDEMFGAALRGLFIIGKRPPVRCTCYNQCSL